MTAPWVPRPLTRRQAITCENSQTHRCRCRCNGACHGMNRSQLTEFFEYLSETDPHWVRKQTKQMPLPRPVGA